MSSLREDYEIESENWTLACFGFLQFAQKKILTLSSLVDVDRKSLRWMRCEWHTRFQCTFGFSPIFQVEKLQSGRARDRWTAADALGRLGRQAAGDGTAVPVLLRCTEDEDDDVRCAAARALGHLGSETSVATLLRLLTDEDGGVRWGAAEGLGNLGSAASSSAAALKEALEDEEEDVRAASAQSLGKLVKLQAIAAADVVSSLIEVLSDEEWSVRRSLKVHSCSIWRRFEDCFDSIFWQGLRWMSLSFESFKIYKHHL